MAARTTSSVFAVVPTRKKDMPGKRGRRKQESRIKPVNTGTTESVAHVTWRGGVILGLVETGGLGILRSDPSRPGPDRLGGCRNEYVEKRTSRCVDGGRTWQRPKCVFNWYMCKYTTIGLIQISFSNFFEIFLSNFLDWTELNCSCVSACTTRGMKQCECDVEEDNYCYLCCGNSHSRCLPAHQYDILRYVSALKSDFRPFCQVLKKSKHWLL